MKKIFLSIATLFSLVIFVNAQNSSPYWSLAGNSNATSSSKLGTTTSINLRFYTNNAERARISTSGLFGIGTTSPTDKLHVNSASGVNAFRAQVNGSTKFIVHSNGSVGIGTSSPSSSYKLQVVGSSSSGTGTYTSGFTYGLQSYATDTYGYGVYASSNYLGVYGNGGTYGLYGSSSNYGVYGTGSSYGVYGSGGTYGVYGTGTSYGVYGNSSSSYGVRGVSSSSTGVYGSGSIGLYGSGTYGVYGSGNSYGAYGFSSSGKGVYGYSSSSNGVYGESYSNDGGHFYSTTGYGIRAGTGNSSKNWAGVFDGNVYTFGAYQTSDRNLKKNIEELGDAMSIINKLKPKNYEFRDDGKFASLHLPQGYHYGLIAQEVEEVLPNIVKESAHDFNDVKAKVMQLSPDGKATVSAEGQKANESINIKAINYTELIPIIIKAMQEQEAKIEALTELVRKLQNTNPEASVKLSGISLDQNVPNPAVANSTKISYYIPAGSATAELIFTNASGQKIKQIQLSRNGAGQVDINTSTLSTGTYFYTLYVNGKSSETRKMIVSRQ